MHVVPPLVARARRHARRFPRVFWLLALVGAIRELGSGVFLPYWALYLTETLGASGAQAGALLGIAGGMGLIGAPLGGILTDTIGRRTTLLLALAGTGAGFIAYGALDSLLAVALLSPLFGIASDLESPAVSAAIADVVEPELRTEAFGLRQQANNITFALGPFLHRDRDVAISTWGLLFTINPIAIGLAQYPVARWAGMKSPRAMLALGIVVQGLAMLLIWPFASLVIVIGAILLLTFGEMLLAPLSSALAVSLAPAHLRGSYEGVLNIAFASMWAPGVFGGLWLVGIGHGELMLALCLPLGVLGALCFIPLPRGPVAVEETLPAAPEAAVAP